LYISLKANHLAFSLKNKYVRHHVTVIVTRDGSFWVGADRAIKLILSAIPQNPQRRYKINRGTGG
jgi:phage terminase Nu1 subunit (DNA packaging protein)